MKYDFIIISTADWNNPFWTNKQHIAKRLADRGHRVLYVDSIGLRRPSVNKRDVKRIFSKLKKFTQGFKKKQNNLWIWSPVVLPLHGNVFVRKLNFKLLELFLKRYSKKLKFNNIILWVYNPLTQSLIGKLNEKLSVYHCVDELAEQPGMPIQTLKSEESTLLEKVDLVYATSLNLYNLKRRFNKHTYYSPNVADFAHFNKAITDNFERPKEFKNISGPIVGFIGAISSYKLNFDLIESVAKMNPELNFIFIGQIGEGEPSTNIEKLTNIKNVFFLGPKDYRMLPRYLKEFDVCLLPNNLNEYTKNMFPMKFFEYLAAGKPVVMTPLDALKDYYDLCYVGHDSLSFSEAIQKAINEKDETIIQKRIQEAKKHDWESRINKMLRIVNEKVSELEI
ncbi:glycosyltransferase [Lentibacillus sp. Marseille-P4043]|uniref:glycosyltransferase n=1 Tax=Lentibacillus sp. Marseille-P4043 TaxID=2040293 RepID=UPI000D0B18CE|nr:glycosyltransferase [Lentibacillus sp. Marseille-P4043]